MSLFVVGVIAALGIVAGLIATLSEQIRVEVKRRQCEERDELLLDQTDLQAPRPTDLPSAKKTRTNHRSTVTPSHEDRAVAYRNLLDSIGDDLDRDIAEWEAVLEEFPHVLLADDQISAQEKPASRVAEETCLDRFADAEKAASPKRSRRIDPEERGQIVRLLNTGFAPEEIALWLNLPLERVQELLERP